MTLCTKHRASRPLASLAFATAIAASGAQAENVLPNGSFESDSTWSTDTAHKIVSNNARSGGKALELTSTGDAKSATTYSNKITAEPFDEFVFDVYVKAQSLVASPNGAGDTPMSMIRFRDGGGYVINGLGKRTEGYRWAPYKRNVGTFGYTNDKMQMRFQMTKTGDGFQAGFRTWSNNRSGRTYWDDATITKLEFPDRGTKLLTLQAEAGALKNASASSHEKEYTGSGYVDIDSGSEGSITWANVPGGGERVVSVRYSWEAFQRPVVLYVNNQKVGDQTPLATGRRGMYATTDFIVNLPSGNNTLKLEVTRKGSLLGNPTIDKIDIYQKAGTTNPPPPPPEPEGPETPTGVSASDSQFTDKVRVSWNSVSGATRYEIARNNNTSGNGQQIGDLSVLRYDDTTAVPSVNYYYRVRACNNSGCGAFSAWDSGSRAESGGGGGGGNSGDEGELNLIVEPSVNNAVISRNAADWLKLGETEVRKANTIRQIFDVVDLGDAGRPYDNAAKGQSWSGGDVIANGDEVTTGRRVFLNDHGLRISARAGTAERTLTLWLSYRGLKNVEDLDAQLRVSLSDNSAEPIVQTFNDSTTRTTGKQVSITYKAENDGETITLDFNKISGKFIAIDAVSLVGGGDSDGGNSAPVISPIATQTIVEGESLYFDLSATDADGDNIEFSLTENLPGLRVQLTDSGNGIGAIDWQSRIGNSGNFEITVTATDSSGLTSSRTVPVVVQTSGNSNGTLSISSALVTQKTITLGDRFVKFAPSIDVESAYNNSGDTPFSSLIRLGGAVAKAATRGAVAYNYTNGTPESGEQVTGGNRVYNAMPLGMEMRVAASQEQKQTTVYVGAQNVLAKVVVSLSDGSAEPQEVMIDHRKTTKKTFAVDIDYSAAAANEELIVQTFILELPNTGTTGWVQLEAAQQQDNN